MVLANPAFFISKLIRPADVLQIKLIAFPQVPLWRVRRHREKSSAYGSVLSF
jgi:hypothetical protein